jgi:hypothetical protein
MNWNAIAALAQVLAAIGVIVSVVYLALQVRQNTHQARLNTESLGVTHEMGGAAMSVDIGLAIARDAELAAWWARERGRFSPALVAHLDDLLTVTAEGIPATSSHSNSDPEGQ